MNLHIPYSDLVIEHNNTPVYYLNKGLLDSQCCWENLEDIKECHQLKLIIYEMIEKTNNKKLLKSLAKDLTEIEYELQRLWKFDLDENYHRFWEYPKCKCPKMDNLDAYPHMQYYSQDCPLHGV